ncbi:MAG: hypothetical protein EB824_01440 [Thaumarchaeota archaeon S15]|nr:MAG: hypothetical protein EB824_01440 [Thaumarchaeota archaeon S15]
MIRLLSQCARARMKESIVERAREIYRLSIERSLVRGRSIAALAASSLYAASREAGASVTLKDIQQACNTTRKDISRCYRLMLRELDMRMPVVDATVCVGRIADNAGLSAEVRREARMLLRRASVGGIAAGKDPMGLAAAALYLACTRLEEHETQKNIAHAAHVTEVTIRNRYKGLRDEVERLGVPGPKRRAGPADAPPPPRREGRAPQGRKRRGLGVTVAKRKGSRRRGARGD